MSQKIFIYGVPGTGKTYTSKILAGKLNLPVIEGDKIRKTAQKGKTRKTHPFLFLGTCLAYKEFGELNTGNAIKGLHAVRNSLKEPLDSAIRGKVTFILEGAFLDPNHLVKAGDLMLLTVPDEKKHRERFLKHREKLFDLSGEEFRAARIIQNYLITEAKKLGIEIMES